MRVGGMAKGSGMIHPNMATMLAAITTDAAVAPALWRDILRRGAANSFNQASLAWQLAARHSCACSHLLLYSAKLADWQQQAHPV